MNDKLLQRRCHVCGQRSLRRVKRAYETQVAHDGRPPVTVRIPDLQVIACMNLQCRPEHPDDTVIEDDAAIWRIAEESYRQLGLLTPTEIRARRERLGLTQQQLQQMLGLGGNSLSRWEGGHVFQARSLDTLLRLFFDVPEVRSYIDRTRGMCDAPKERRFRYLERLEERRQAGEKSCEHGFVEARRSG